MEDLKTLLELIARLPQMALWVALGFWAYKVVVIGSIYGVIRLGIIKLHSWLTTPKHELIYQDVRLLLDGEVITGSKDALVAQLQRIKRSTGQYVHPSDIAWLREAIDEKLAKEQK
jgi:predicted transcriptional regulator